ncbi:hypothetical protein HYDPIDRAFT_29488 [Hydnomerulius pinastri MD-312]|uniref:Unplaced genomic scaffold scaffold_17, whole genome shotgun sequence n=1 Tax=Hydnomerulius pinastri MD-312 TaxID=994086 RepID=A0A0C9VC92_9AGAM|nr:hypothetical protein HYDPIDRAFT_29488 [Hydnomerulius pinastri MD-312]
MHDVFPPGHSTLPPQPVNLDDCSTFSTNSIPNFAHPSTSETLDPNFVASINWDVLRKRSEFRRSPALVL